MFIGHFGAGFAGKKIDSGPSLGTMFMAAQFIDLLWPLLLVLGIEHVRLDPGNTKFTPLDFYYYPFSHSLTAVIIWGILFGAVHFFFKKNIRASILLGILVVSHWFLDLIVHRPDLPLFSEAGVKAGLGLWNSILFTIILEGGIFAAGIYLYLKSTRAENRKGSIALWSLIFFLIIVYIMNIFVKPDSVDNIGYAGFAQWLFIIWAYWADKNRKPITT